MDGISRMQGSVALVLLVFMLLSVYVAAPNVTEIGGDFNYRADIISIDNFYDVETEEFTGEVQSKTTFKYTAVGKKDDVLLIRGVFDVKTIGGEPIFMVERMYGVNPTDYAHVPGYGDLDRKGHFFLPKHIKKGEGFTYWFIATDDPVQLAFVNEERIGGVPVYHYRKILEEVDLSAGYTHLSGVPDRRRVKNDILLEAWFEPKTGRLVKFAESADSGFYDAVTGEKLHPRNKYSNTYTEDSVAKQIALIKNDVKTLTLYRNALPALLAAMAAVTIVISLTKSFRSLKAIIISMFLVNGLVVWFINVSFFLEKVYILLMLSAGISLGLGLALTSVLVGPIRELEKTFTHISKGNLNVQIGKSNLKEIQALLSSTQTIVTSLKVSIFRKRRDKESDASASRRKPKKGKKGNV